MFKKPQNRDLIELLQMLSDWLHVKYPGQSWTLSILGGAALVFTGQKDSTLDIDVLDPFPLPKQLIEGASAVARARGISPSWLSDECR